MVSRRLIQLLMDRDRDVIPIINCGNQSHKSFVTDKLYGGLNADMVIIDDPHARAPATAEETEAILKKLLLSEAWNTYTMPTDKKSSSYIVDDGYYPMVEKQVENKTPNGMRQPPNQNKKMFTNVDRRIRTKKKKQAKKQRIKSCHTR